MLLKSPVQVNTKADYPGEVYSGCSVPVKQDCSYSYFLPPPPYQPVPANNYYAINNSIVTFCTGTGVIVLSDP